MQINRRHGIHDIASSYPGMDEHNFTVRVKRDKHLASFRDEMNFFARINQFRARIGAIAAERTELDREKLEKVRAIKLVVSDSVARLSTPAPQGYDSGRKTHSHDCKRASACSKYTQTSPPRGAHL